MHRTSSLVLSAFTALSIGAASCLMDEAKSIERPALAADAGSKARCGAGGRASAQMGKGSEPAKKAVDAGRETRGDAAVEPPAHADEDDAGPLKRVCGPIDTLDLLMMVDNSNSMAGEQESFRVAFQA